MNRSLVGKVDDLMSFQTEKIDQILSKVQCTDGNLHNEEVSKVTEKLIETVESLEENNLKLAKSVQDLENRHRPQSSDSRTPSDSLVKWQSECQEIMLRMAEKLENIEKVVGKPEMKDEIMIISVSNGKYFDPKRLHHEKTVKMEHTFTLDSATKKIPVRENPEKIKDIVFMTGLNDSKDHRTSVEEIINRQKDACHKYHHRFKNAQFHIVTVPPETQKQRNLNRRLKEYATSAGISFVDNDVLHDEQTGDLKPDVLENYHYTRLGTRLLAAQLKRSLYANGLLQENSFPNRPHQTHQNGRQQPDFQHYHNQQQSNPTRHQIPFSQRTTSLDQQFRTPQQQNQQTTLPRMTNPWVQQQNSLPSTFQPSPAGVNELFTAMGNFLQKWQTSPGLSL